MGAFLKRFHQVSYDRIVYFKLDQLAWTQEEVLDFLRGVEERIAQVDDVAVPIWGPTIQEINR